MQTNSVIHRKIRKYGLAICKHVPAMRKLRYAYWHREANIYRKYSERTTTNEKAVVFEAFGGRQYACSPKAIYEAMIANPYFDNWSFYWSFNGYHMRAMEEEGLISPKLARAQLITRGSEEYFNAFATSKYWIQNNRVPEYVTPRDDQIYVQCWHGTPLKRLGYDVPESTGGGALNSAHELAERFNLDAQKWTYLLSPSPFTSQHLADAFGLPESKRKDVIIEEGYPRNDSIAQTIDASHAEELAIYLKGKYELPLDKKLLLFAPTWRDDQYTEGVGYTLNALADFNLLQQKLGNEWIVLLRTHYYIANKFDLSAWEGFVYNVSSVDDINDLYCIADALCTDYSSVFFDYANTKRPLYFYWPDKEHYDEMHGFYIDENTLPGPKCETTEELAQAILDNDAWFDNYGKDYEVFRETYCAKDDGHATDRVIKKVFGV